MPKSYSGQSFTLGLDPQTTKPLDVRDSVDTISDIYLPSTWKNGNNYYVYPSMKTVAKDTGIIAIYIGNENDPTDIADTSKWVLYQPGGGTITLLTLEEYTSLATKEFKMYYIWDSNHLLQRIYFCNTLIAKRGETASNIGFPLVFPIIFN